MAARGRKEEVARDDDVVCFLVYEISPNVRFGKRAVSTELS